MTGVEQSQFCILCLEDLGIVKALTTTLEKEGYRVSHAPSVQSAVKMFDEEAPDSLVVDTKLEGVQELLDLAASQDVRVHTLEDVLG